MKSREDEEFAERVMRLSLRNQFGLAGSQLLRRPTISDLDAIEATAWTMKLSATRLNNTTQGGEVMPMTEILATHTIDTPAGTFEIYPGSQAQDPESHKPLRWYYAPEGWTGKPYSEDYLSAEAAQEACWESLRKST